jgi:hypothetical protein
MHLNKRLERGVERGDLYVTKQNKQNIEIKILIFYKKNLL